MTGYSDSQQGKRKLLAPSPSDLLDQCASGIHAWAHQEVYPYRPKLRRLVCLVCLTAVDLPLDDTGKVTP
jgi:hypothetical protein